MPKSLTWSIVQPLAGGLGIGAMQAFRNKPKYILSTPQFFNNDNHFITYMKDVDYISEENLFNIRPPSKVDAVFSVPICSGLSLLNNSKGRGPDAPQNDNMLNNTKYVLEVMKPKVFTFENAPALFTFIAVPLVEKLKNVAFQYGYSLSLYRTNTILHGIPQNRPRTFAMFWKGNKCPIMEYEKIDNMNLVEYLNEIPKTSTQNNLYPNEEITDKDDYVFCKEIYGNNLREEFHRTGSGSLMNMIIRTNRLEQYINWCHENNRKGGVPEHIKNKLSKGKGFWDNSTCFAPISRIGAVQGRMFGRILHPKEDRDFSLRELIWLMGHPHDFEILGGLKNLNHIAQNVPVCTAKFIASQMKKFLEGKLIMSSEKFLKQDNTKKRIPQINIDSIL